MTHFQLSIWDHLLFVLLGILLPALLLFRSPRNLTDISFDSRTKIRIYYANGLMIWFMAFLVITLWWLSNRSFTSIGFRAPTLNPTVVLLSLCLLAAYITDVLVETSIPSRLQKTKENWKKNTPFLPSDYREFAHYNFLAFSAGIGEEIVYRGFFILYLLSLCGSSGTCTIWAIIIPAFLFGISHLYQGGKAVIKIIVLAILLGSIYLESQSLWIVMGIHVLIDVLGGWLSLGLLKEDRSEE